MREFVEFFQNFKLSHFQSRSGLVFGIFALAAIKEERSLYPSLFSQFPRINICFFNYLIWSNTRGTTILRSILEFLVGVPLGPGARIDSQYPLFVKWTIKRGWLWGLNISPRKIIHMLLEISRICCKEEDIAKMTLSTKN